MKNYLLVEIYYNYVHCVRNIKFPYLNHLQLFFLLFCKKKLRCQDCKTFSQHPSALRIEAWLRVFSKGSAPVVISSRINCSRMLDRQRALPLKWRRGSRVNAHTHQPFSLLELRRCWKWWQINNFAKGISSFRTRANFTFCVYSESITIMYL